MSAIYIGHSSFTLLTCKNQAKLDTYLTAGTKRSAKLDNHLKKSKLFLAKICYIHFIFQHASQ